METLLRVSLCMRVCVRVCMCVYVCVCVLQLDSLAPQTHAPAYDKCARMLVVARPTPRGGEYSGAWRVLRSGGVVSSLDRAPLQP